MEQHFISLGRDLSGMQDLTSWTRDGIAGLQSVVLYSLPELDGAIDAVPLGGLMGNNIFLVPERVKRLSARLRKWVDLRRTPKQVRTAADIPQVAPFFMQRKSYAQHSWAPV